MDRIHIITKHSKGQDFYVNQNLIDFGSLMILTFKVKLLDLFFALNDHIYLLVCMYIIIMY
jgi:hypothetical protein